MNYESWKWQLNFKRKIDRGIIEMNTNRNANANRLPTLFIMAKTYGASKEFVLQNDLENKVKNRFRDIQFLYKADQLRGLKAHEVYIIKIPRHVENEMDLLINKEAEIRNMPIIESFTFLDSIHSSG